MCSSDLWEENVQKDDVEYLLSKFLETEDLAPRHKGGLSLIVVKIKLLPDEQPKVKTIPITKEMLLKALESKKK